MVRMSIAGFLFLVGTTPLWAQGGKGAKDVKKAFDAVEKAVTGNISKEAGRVVDRVSLAAKQARLAQQLEERAVKVHFAPMGGPNRVHFLMVEDYQQTLAKHAHSAVPKYVNPYELYPNAPEGLTPESLAYYIAIKSDLEARKLSVTQGEREEQAKALWNTPGFLEKVCIGNTVPEEKEAKWLASQIKPDTQYLLVDAEYNGPEIHLFISDLVEEIQSIHKARKIFLLSEFFGEEFQAYHQDISLYGSNDSLRLALFHAGDVVEISALAHNIPVFGLEPNFVLEAKQRNEDEAKLAHHHGYYGNDLFAQPEGIRLRNERWLKTIRAYREKYPDALFIVYAQKENLGYGASYSLGDVLAGEKTFVVEVGHRGSRPPSEKWKSATVGLEELSPEVRRTIEREKVLWMEDPKEARVMGFDVRIALWSLSPSYHPGNCDKSNPVIY